MEMSSELMSYTDVVVIDENIDNIRKSGRNPIKIIVPEHLKDSFIAAAADEYTDQEYRGIPVFFDNPDPSGIAIFHEPI